MVLKNSGRLIKANDNNAESSSKRLETAQLSEELDEKFSYKNIKSHCEKVGWLINMCSADIISEEDKRIVSAVDFYFLQEDGSRFKISYPFLPYFYVAVENGNEKEVLAYLQKKFSKIKSVEILKKEDLDLHNHLIGLKQNYIKLSFYHVDDMNNVRQAIHRAVRKNKERKKGVSAYATMLTSALTNKKMSDHATKVFDQLDNVRDVREYDVPYHVRVSIDLKIHVGLWYTVKYRGSDIPPLILRRDDLLERPDPVILAFDIETTKLPLKFPDPETDNIIMISYMIDGCGYLICNREIVSEDVEDFEFTPRPEFEGNFTVFNEPNELNTIHRFFDHILDVKPHIIVTYNGDFFDWPFVEARAFKYGLNMMKEIGFSKDSQGEYKSRQTSHMDAFKWVKRDSYLPVGSQNLKAAAKAKLRYDPVELDPEEICRLASEQPQTLANYSVSDAVATYYIYMKYVHPFIFALCTIIPLEPDSVLRKGSGTLCESLLMVQAYHANIIFPNKQETVFNKLTSDGHVLDAETYVGGHVEALECGVFRSDIPCDFRGDPDAYMDLHGEVERTIKFCIEVEEKIPLSDVLNYDEVCNDIKKKLLELRGNPIRCENPIIYHLDVGAMYPNIILTNRLQPSAMVDESICAACDFNKPGATCQRSMSWKWRGEFMPASRSEFHRIQQQLENERFPNSDKSLQPLAFHELTKEEQAKQEKKRLQEYCRRAYNKVKVKRFEERFTTVCQRENSFYVDTVRMFRDRRYEFKAALKRAKKQVSEAIASGDAAQIKKAKGMEVLYDSLQLAHKCILNSFYGYVMRKGARWYSMEMAGIVCYTGAKIIQNARSIVDKIGRPLELDTDGIWCVLPSSFPENYVVLTKNPKKPKVTISYPGAMLNVMVKDQFTNDQYEELIDPSNLTYSRRSENSIFFEVDGPYLAMVLPAAKEEGKSLKKRYAVFNFDGSLAELKGFEVKRRGELQLIKIFQSSVFEAFLIGNSLSEVYESVAKVADYWLDVLYSKAANMPDSELFDLISENRSMSRKLEDYGGQKSTSISTAKRLAEFLGDQMVKDAGLSCRFIISKKPDGAPVTERAIPMAIFQSEIGVKKHYLRKWTKQSNMDDFDIRSVLDWDYYIERLGSAIQKIITIPAALQGVANPVPRVAHPDWLHKRLVEKGDIFKQKRITDLVQLVPRKRQLELNGESADLIDSSAKTYVENCDVPPAKKRNVNEQVDLLHSWRDVLGDPPPGKDLFQGTFTQRLDWIYYHKKKWEIQRKQRKAMSESSFTAGRFHQKSAPVTGLGDYLRRKSQAIHYNSWEVIELAETDSPGLIKVFTLIESELHVMKINVPRIFYINRRKNQEVDFREAPHGGSVSWRKVNRVLPRSAQLANMYEYRIQETDFLQHSSNIHTEFSDPDVIGVYELNVPLMMRVLIELGCCWRMSRKAAKQLATIDTDSFDFENFHFCSTADSTYLAEGSLKDLFLYHKTAGNKHLSALFISASKKCHVFVADRARVNRMPNINSIYRKEREKCLEEGVKESELPDEEFSFEIKFEVDIKQLFKGLQRNLSSYKDEGRGPTCIFFQSNYYTANEFRSLVPMTNQFPFVVLSNKSSDGFGDEFNWQKEASFEMLHHFLNIKLTIGHLIDQSRYYHIPVANLGSNPLKSGADLFFARRLQKNNHLLWWSPSNRPGLGGMELDDNRLDAEETRDKISVEINNPGFYQSVCVQIDLSSLDINTVLQSHHINEVEGAASDVITFDNVQKPSLEEMMSDCLPPSSNLASYDEVARCSSSFRIIKSMIQGWLRDVSLHRSVLADQLLQYFHVWISDPSTPLYDPALYRTLKVMLNKLFLQLVAEMKRLGSKVVFADFNRIIVSTRKRTVCDAQSYMDYVINSILEKDFFHLISLSKSHYWEHLLWMDPFNHGGIKSEERDNDDDNDVDVVEMNFNLGRYLPASFNVQETFETVIAGYISMIYQESKRERESLVDGSTPVLRRNDVQSQLNVSGLNEEERLKAVVPNDSKISPHMVVFAQDLIIGDLSHQMFSLSQKLMKSLPTGSSAEGLFPHLPGSHLSLKNPTLEFVKSVCKVLASDQHVTPQVEKLRRNLLRLIGVGEFSSQSDWDDPCCSYVLHQVACSSCNVLTNLDLCRSFKYVNKSCCWFCAACGKPFSVTAIEQLIVADFQQKLMTFTLQDVTCVRCGDVKLGSLNRRCECAGHFTMTSSSSSLQKSVEILKNISSQTDMTYLSSVLDWLILNT